MKLRELLNGVPVASCAVDLEMEITGVSYDSRTTASGDVFVAISGEAVDGHRFIPMAAEKGAEFITVFYGDGISEADAQHAEQRFIDACPEAEVSLLPGGQPVYYYIISIE